MPSRLDFVFDDRNVSATVFHGIVKGDEEEYEDLLSARQEAEGSLLLNAIDLAEIRVADPGHPEIWKPWLMVDTAVYKGRDRKENEVVAIAHSVGPLTDLSFFASAYGYEKTAIVTEEVFRALIEGRFGTVPYKTYTEKDLDQGIAVDKRSVIVLPREEVNEGLSTASGRRVETYSLDILRQSLLLSACLGGNQRRDRYLGAAQSVFYNTMDIYHNFDQQCGRKVKACLVEVVGAGSQSAGGLRYKKPEFVGGYFIGVPKTDDMLALFRPESKQIARDIPPMPSVATQAYIDIPNNPQKLLDAYF